MLYAHATIITVNPYRNIILDGAILVRDAVIADIDKADILLAKYPGEQVTSLEGCIIIPGLNVPQTLLGRNHATISSLIPALGNFTAKDGYAADRLSIAEML
ncbi:hypothetical protein VTN77DRAFT_9902 [Rasamsonia byssochlamydoides]|uniref:uncharacterized protein n=1 Tax=Rasamsonia byssochlamydoides TaxID=89139 RepID=UPI0037440395